MEYKYEPIFGDQSLFDGAPDGATHATKGGGFYAINDGIAKFASDGMFNGIDVCTIGGYLIAERRIIKEPKRWTVADQKAGRLPEVGAHLLTEGNLAEFIGLSNANNNWCFRRLDGEHGIQTANKDWFAPIETPAEKAARLKSEWCAKAAKQLKNLEYTSTLTSIYDALLSGELKAPESTE